MAPSDALKADTEQSDTDCGPRRRQTRLTECVFTQYEGDGGTHLWLLFLHSLKGTVHPKLKNQSLSPPVKDAEVS